MIDILGTLVRVVTILVPVLFLLGVIALLKTRKDDDHD